MKETINFTNSKGEKLVGDLYITGKKTKSIVVIAHGFMTDRFRSSSIYAHKLAEIGIDSFAFDFWGHGESEGNIEDITVSEGVDDVIRAIEFVKLKGYEKISLLGTSFGGACVIQAAIEIPDIQALVLRSPVPDYFTLELMRFSREELLAWKDKGFREYTSVDGDIIKLKYSFFQDHKNHLGLHRANEISAKTLIIHGDQDKTVPILLSEMLYKVIPNCKMEVFKGGDHTMKEPVFREKIVKNVVEFLRENA